MRNMNEVSRYKRLLRNLGEHYKIIHANPFGRIGFWVIAFFLFVAILAPWLAPHDPWEMQYDSEGILLHYKCHLGSFRPELLI